MVEGRGQVARVAPRLVVVVVSKQTACQRSFDLLVFFRTADFPYFAVAGSRRTSRRFFNVPIVCGQGRLFFDISRTDLPWSRGCDDHGRRHRAWDPFWAVFHFGGADRSQLSGYRTFIAAELWLSIRLSESKKIDDDDVDRSFPWTPRTTISPKPSPPEAPALINHPSHFYSE